MKNKIKMIEKPDQWQLNKHEIRRFVHRNEMLASAA